MEGRGPKSRIAYTSASGSFSFAGVHDMSRFCCFARILHAVSYQQAGQMSANRHGLFIYISEAWGVSPTGK